MTILLALSLLACNSSGAVTLDDNSLTNSDDTGSGDDTGNGGDDTGNGGDDTGEVQVEEPIVYSGRIWGSVPDWDDYTYCEGEIELSVDPDGQFSAETRCEGDWVEHDVRLEGKVDDEEISGVGTVVLEGREGETYEEDGELEGDADEEEFEGEFVIEVRMGGGPGGSRETEVEFFVELQAQ